MSHVRFLLLHLFHLTFCVREHDERTVVEFSHIFFKSIFGWSNIICSVHQGVSSVVLLSYWPEYKVVLRILDCWLTLSCLQYNDVTFIIMQVLYYPLHYYWWFYGEYYWWFSSNARYEVTGLRVRSAGLVRVCFTLTTIETYDARHSDWPIRNS